MNFRRPAPKALAARHVEAVRRPRRRPAAGLIGYTHAVRTRRGEAPTRSLRGRPACTALAAYEIGDDAWSVGCRDYAFGKQRLKRAADSRNHPWLRVVDDSHHFIFLIDQVPVRFYRGPADDPTARTLRRQKAEADQLGLALGVDAAEGLVFRLAIETGSTGGVERVGVSGPAG